MSIQEINEMLTALEQDITDYLESVRRQTQPNMLLSASYIYSACCKVLGSSTFDPESLELKVTPAESILSWLYKSAHQADDAQDLALNCQAIFQDILPLLSDILSTATIKLAEMFTTIDASSLNLLKNEINYYIEYFKKSLKTYNQLEQFNSFNEIKNHISLNFHPSFLIPSSFLQECLNDIEPLGTREGKIIKRHTLNKLSWFIFLSNKIFHKFLLSRFPEHLLALHILDDEINQFLERTHISEGKEQCDVDITQVDSQLTQLLTKIEDFVNHMGDFEQSIADEESMWEPKKLTNQKKLARLHAMQLVEQISFSLTLHKKLSQAFDALFYDPFDNNFAQYNSRYEVTEQILKRELINLENSQKLAAILMHIPAPSRKNSALLFDNVNQLINDCKQLASTFVSITRGDEKEMLWQILENLTGELLTDISLELEANFNNNSAVSEKNSNTLPTFFNKPFTSVNELIEETTLLNTQLQTLMDFIDSNINSEKEFEKAISALPNKEEPHFIFSKAQFLLKQSEKLPSSPGKEKLTRVLNDIYTDANLIHDLLAICENFFIKTSSRESHLNNLLKQLERIYTILTSTSADNPFCVAPSSTEKSPACILTATFLAKFADYLNNDSHESELCYS